MNHFFMKVLLCFIVITSCSNDDTNSNSEQGNNPNSNSQVNKDLQVFLGQTHVLQVDNPLFGLVSNKSALLKVNIAGKKGDPSPPVEVTLSLNGNNKVIILNGPSEIPIPIDVRPGKIKHTFDDSFTAIIEKEWIQPGLMIKVEAGDDVKELSNIKIGAPNKVIMNMFDVHFFSNGSGDYTNGWRQELEAKWPSSGIELIRLAAVKFNELTVPPRGGDIIAARVSSKEEYKEITGYNFDGEQAAASQWSRALKAAAGIKGRYSLFYVNIYGVASGGQAGGFAGVGNGKKIGLLHHELGHALSLPHWGNNQGYPYKGDMHGIEAPDVYKETHAGPTWAFDLVNNKFIPPTIQENTIGYTGKVGQYKVDPMQGGGIGTQEKEYLLNHFSDFSVNRMRNYLEGHIVVWNDQIGSYATWDSSVGSYSKMITNNGVDYAIERNIDVISVMAGVSALTPQANIIYPPVGPYKSGIIDLFDPTNEEDRVKADEIYCPDGGCDVSVRVKQGEVTRLYMLPISMDASVAPSNARSYTTKAVNLRASDGLVTKIELLLTPEVEKNGMPVNETILYTWNSEF